MNVRIALSALLAWVGLTTAALAQEAPYLVVAGSPELEAAIKPLIELRSRDLGGAAVIAPLKGGTPTAIRESLARTIRERRPRFLLLVGDVDLIPTFVVSKAATDRPFGDFDGDGFPEVAIGRIPFSDPVIAARVARRIVAYETRREGALWRRQLAMVAGEGRFSPAIDAMIERMFAQIVSENVGLGYDVDLTYANPRSPYCYPPEGFSGRVVQRLDEGALVFAYVGHGNVRNVDDLTVPGKGGVVRRFGVLSAENAHRLQVTRSPSVFLAIACWTGKFEGRVRCIGEELLAAEGGPVAFFGSSRVSHPVHNALLAKELVYELLSETGVVRLGPALDRARKAMVKGRQGPDPVRMQIVLLSRAFVPEAEMKREMPRHVDMYNLLGDPALRLARPEEAIALKAPAKVQAGQEVVVRGVLSERFQAVTLAIETDREGMAQPQGKPDETPLERYARANDKVLRQDIVRVRGGRFELTFLAPKAPGRYVIKAFAQDETTCAAGGFLVRVVR